MLELARSYDKEQTFDGSTGECCLKWENQKAAKCIMIIDMMLIVIDPPRGIAACQAYKSDERKAYYAKTRYMTFWIYSVLMLLGTIGYIFSQIIQGENPYFVIVLGILAGVCIWILLDFHYCRCINFWAKAELDEEKRQKDAMAAEMRAFDEEDQPRRRSTKSRDSSKSKKRRGADSRSDNTDLTNDKPRRKSGKGKKKKRKSK